MVRPAYALTNDEIVAKPYRRQIDIVTKDDDGNEIWIETKSLSKSTFSKGKFKNQLSNSKSYYRQFYHDMRLNDKFISSGNRRKILDDGKWVGNKQYYWYFHEFSTKKGNPPGSKEETNARKWLCQSPEGVTRDFFDSNFKTTVSQGVAEQLCGSLAFSRIELRDTQSYITELLEPYAAELNIKDFVELIKKLTKSEEG